VGVPRFLPASFALFALLVTPLAGHAQGTVPLTVLDVPFQAQTELLCGGAAAAMVLGYWGTPGTDASAFAPLVDRKAGGIRGDALAGALRSRGWFAQSFRGTPALVRAHLARGRPLVVLIEDSPGRHHYVVVVAWREHTVLVHDPARGPFHAFDVAAFTHAWAATGFWTLLILPEAGQPHPGRVTLADGSAPVPRACEEEVDRAITLARAGDHDRADVLLRDAGQRCPDSAAVSRERAGLRFLESDWQDAARFAERAVSQAPTDAHAWRLLAASRFMQGDRGGALRAWNAIGEPHLGRVNLDLNGAMPAATVQQVLDLKIGEVLTADDLRRAQRRLNNLPGMSARVGYTPGSTGHADVDVALTTRRRSMSWSRAVAMTARATTERELQVDLPVLSGKGAGASVHWRWSDAHPQLALALQVPSAFGRVGAWSVQALWERQSFHTPATADATDPPGTRRDTRRGVALRYADWMRADTWLSTGVALDRWSEAGSYVTFSAGVDTRLADDRLSLQGHGAVAPALGQAHGFGRAGATLAWRSSQSKRDAVVMVRAGLEAATREAPLGVWPRAGTTRDSQALARAHPDVQGGAAGGSLLGRRLVHASFELQVPLAAPPAVRLGLTVFGDAARAWRGLDPRVVPQTQIDVGIGLSLHFAGFAPALQVDVARGLRDGNQALSVRWQLPWPGVDH
jgi:hypothetical protein